MKYMIEEPNTGCWIFLGTRDRRGYGQLVIWDSDRQQKSVVTAHRLAYTAWRGPIPDGFQVCHRCDNPPCINPAHLFVGTQQDNVDDMVRKGRSARQHGARHGLAKYSKDKILAIRDALELSGGKNQEQIAEQFGVGQSHVSRMWTRTTWRDVLNG